MPDFIGYPFLSQILRKRLDPLKTSISQPLWNANFIPDFAFKRSKKLDLLKSFISHNQPNANFICPEVCEMKDFNRPI